MADWVMEGLMVLTAWCVLFGYASYQITHGDDE